MQEKIKEFIKICSETLDISVPIYEFGSMQVLDQVGFADLRPFFPDKEYVGSDMREGPGVDIVLNLHNIDLPDESVGTAIVMETVEHVEYVRKAMDELYRVLKPNGILVVSSHMNCKIHGHPCDYWRFTPYAFKSLLSIFDSSIVGYVGKEEFPNDVVGIGFKGPVSEDALSEFRIRFEEWMKYWSHPKRLKKKPGFFAKLGNSIKKRWRRVKGIFGNDMPSASL